MAKLGESKGGPSVFARRLRQARLRRGLSQKALGIAIGIDPSSASSRINQYERGKHSPDYATAERIAKALDVATPYLFAREEAVAELILAPALHQPEAEYVLSDKELMRRFRKLKTDQKAVVARVVAALTARGKNKS